LPFKTQPGNSEPKQTTFFCSCTDKYREKVGTQHRLVRGCI